MIESLGTRQRVDGALGPCIQGFAMSTPKRKNTESPVPVNTVCCLLSTLRRAPAPEQGGGRTTPYSLAARTPSGPCKPHRTQSHPHRSHTYDRLFLLPPPHSHKQPLAGWLTPPAGPSPRRHTTDITSSDPVHLGREGGVARHEGVVDEAACGYLVCGGGVGRGRGAARVVASGVQRP